VSKHKRQIRWVIAYGIYDFYVGAQLTRKAAIAEHCVALGKTWAECRAKGDYAVKCYLLPMR